jgi:hypothetical protein
MSVTLHLETAYSFRRLESVVFADAGRDDTQVLARIDRLLVSAGEAFRSRRHLDAIDDYTAARRLIWSQLFPSSAFDEVKIAGIDLIRPLASYAGEWMNVLPGADVGAVGVRPREAVAVDTGPVTGIHVAALDAAAAEAAADLGAAELHERHGNLAAASFFRDRASSVAPDLVHAVVASAAIPPGTTAPGVRALSGASGGTPLRTVELPAAVTAGKRSYVVEVGTRVRTITWDAGRAPAVDKLLSTVFDARKALKVLPDALIRPSGPADAAAALPHVWYYETPLGLAECHHAMGNWSEAESWYLAAARYQYLNANVEAPYVWGRLADLYRDWGNRLFRTGEVQAAVGVYGKVMGTDGSEPASELYSIAGLAPGADVARAALADLAAPETVTGSPSIVAPILDIWAQLTKIDAGLDFWGHWAANVPIWTFDYLQSVAVNFCQLAISAERDAVSFWEKADQGELTRLQLEQNVAQARAEAAAAAAQVTAAQAQVTAYEKGEQAARRRADNAAANADEYAQKSSQWTMHQALAGQLGAGDDGNAAELNRLAERMLSGPYSISGDRGALVGAEQLAAARLQRSYEVNAMRRQQADLEASAAQATAERKAAQARALATMASAHAAAVRVDGALELVQAFDQQRFTPDVWNKLGERLDALSDRYLVMALDVAKLMQRAYNFDNDTDRALVKADYAADTVKGLLAADALMADIQSFTYDMVTSTAPARQPVRQTISLARQYPFLFERDFRATGRMEFDTRIDDFDLLYPGSYAGRVEHVEVAVDGIVPARGISGTLTNAGISHYRTPSSVWDTGNGLKHRVQNRETMIISDHDVRADAVVTDTDRRRRRVFEGAGVCSSWTLELPRAVNDLDFDAITDVRLTFTYEARFDPDLRDRVLAELAALPALHERQRPVPVRWLFPDAFFTFYDTGVLGFTIEQEWFPRSERDPELIALGLVVATTPTTRRGGLVLDVTPPDAATTRVSTQPDGIVAETAITNVSGTTAVGDYRIELPGSENPSWVDDGALALDDIDNIAMILEYSFTPRA